MREGGSERGREGGGSHVACEAIDCMDEKYNPDVKEACRETGIFVIPGMTRGRSTKEVRPTFIVRLHIVRIPGSIDPRASLGPGDFHPQKSYKP